MKSYGQQLVFLELLINCHPQQRQALLKTISDSQTNFLSLVLHNILQGKVILESEHRRQLQRHASLIRKIARKTTPISVKRSLLINHNRLVKIIFKPLIQGLKNILCNNGKRDGISPQGEVGKGSKIVQQ